VQPLAKNTAAAEIDRVSGPTPKPGVPQIAPYKAARGDSNAIRYSLASNESALGPGQAASVAFQAAAAKMYLYPDGGAHALRDAIAAEHGLDPARIVCGNGSDELLTLIANAYLRPGDEVLFSAHAFLVYRMAALANSATPVAAPEPGLRVDVDRMLAHVTPKTRLVYIANPNNPTGTWMSGAELRRLHAGLPAHILLVIDSAYAEYMQDSDYESGAEIAAEFDNVVMTRTLSKAYALAGLRVGWAYASPAIFDVLIRVRGPFNVSAEAQRADVAALQDREHLARAVENTAQWRVWLTGQIRALGLRVDDSAGNFVLIQFADESAARAADTFLLEHGIALRPTAAYGLPQALRLTIGTEDANRAVVSALAALMKSRS
jgi:histidinol-phosphate aminotransferase